MKKILIVQSRIAKYRVELFNLLNHSYNLTVMYSDGSVPGESEFKTIQVNNRKDSMFWRYDCDLGKLVSEYDAVILPMDVRQIDAVMQVVRKKTKIISWGIGVSASYHVPFDSKKLPILEWTYIRNSAACLFYSEYAAKKYQNILHDRAFVSINTVPVKKIEWSTQRDSLLFIGSLYAEKGIDELLAAYKSAYNESKGIPCLRIIGDGAERERIQQFLADNDLTEKITLCGEVFDEEVLAKEFSRAIACLSPRQAGLSVLKSMGYGVPFVTHRNAITGGERLNIINGENGVLFETGEDLKQVIRECETQMQKYLDYGKRAYAHYWENCTLQKMAEGFCAAIEYVTR